MPQAPGSPALIKDPTLLRWFAAGARIVLGTVFVTAGLPKVLDSQSFLVSVINYQLLSYNLARFVATGLPILEVVLGVLLILGLWTRPIAAVSSILLVVFMLGIMSAWARGLSINCGCFGSNEIPADPVYGYLIDLIRNTTLLATTIFVWRMRGGAVSGDTYLDGTR